MKSLLASILLFSAVLVLHSCKQSGCTEDPASLSYDILAEEDDGSCLYCDSILTEMTTLTFYLKDVYTGSPHINQNIVRFDFIQRTDTFNFSECGDNGCKIFLRMTSLVPENMDIFFSVSSSSPHSFFFNENLTISSNEVIDLGRIHQTTNSNCRLFDGSTLNMSLESPVVYF